MTNTTPAFDLSGPNTDPRGQAPTPRRMDTDLGDLSAPADGQRLDWLATRHDWTPEQAAEYHTLSLQYQAHSIAWADAHLAGRSIAAAWLWDRSAWLASQLRNFAS
jgi:hypothetical protein